MKTLIPVVSLLLASCTTYLGKQKFEHQKDAFYAGNTEERQKGEVYIPEGKGPFPGVVVVHGGGWDSRDFEDMNSVSKSLASHGFVVYNINYRLAPKHRHPAPIEDLKTALAYFKKNADKFKLDPKRIGLWGYSSGGHTVSSYALLHAGQEDLKVQAVVAGGTPFDFTWYDQSPIIKSYLGKLRDDMLKEYYAASPMFMVTDQAPPFYLYHAKEDKLVEFAQSMAFAARLKSHSVPVETHKIGWWGHATALIFSEEAVVEGIKFMQKRLNEK